MKYTYALERRNEKWSFLPHELYEPIYLMDTTLTMSFNGASNGLIYRQTLSLVCFCLTTLFQIHSLQLTPWSRVNLEKVIVAQLVMNFPFLYRHRRLTTLFTGNFLKPVECGPHPPKGTFNVIHPATPRPRKWYLNFNHHPENVY